MTALRHLCPRLPDKTHRLPGRPPGGRIRSGLATATVVMAVVAGAIAWSAPAAAHTDDQPWMNVSGRGWGHGRGMGQYGALGYARDHGWTSSRILDHYYGDTTGGPAPADGLVDPDRVRVDLGFMVGRDTIVELDTGSIAVRSGDGSSLANVSDGAVRVVADGPAMKVQVGPSCDGPWTERLVTSSTVRLTANGTSGQDRSELLAVCGASRRLWVDGEVRALAPAGVPHTLNVVSIEQYLRGVVPNEVPASWPAPVLEAQAVAARSYALAGDTRFGDWADTCDTTRCQVYDGRYTTRGGGARLGTHPRTDAAVEATAGLVRLEGRNVARTEFSSSTGGYTAGGDFPAVVDDGDSVAANPNHTWTAEVDLIGLESRYGKGRLLDVEVVARDGNGPDGGRARSVVYRFEQGTVTVDGWTARSQLGLKSDWFVPGPVRRGPHDVEADQVLQPESEADDSSSGTDTTETNDSSSGTDTTENDTDPVDPYIDRVFERLAGRAPTDVERGRWRTAVADGDPSSMAVDLVVTEDRLAGTVVEQLYMRALDRTADRSGRRYWVDQLQAGVGVEMVGTQFYGSAEYVERVGGPGERFVASLYRRILEREPDRAGLAYWVEQLATEQAEPADVAAGFHRSVESRRERARFIHELLFERVPDQSEIEAVAERLLDTDDLVVAAEVASAVDA